MKGREDHYAWSTVNTVLDVEPGKGFRDSYTDVGLDVFVGDMSGPCIGLTEVTARADTMARTDVAMRTCDAYRWCRERWTNCHFPPTG